jgi:acyl carrier protein
MMPQHVFILNELPYLPNGKIDKKILLGLNTFHQAGTLEVNNKTEEVIASVFAELLQVEINDCNSNFFDIGLNSFLVIKACDILSTKLNAILRPTDLFQFPTIKLLSDHIGKWNISEQNVYNFTTIETRVNKKKQNISNRRNKRKFSEERQDDD